MSSHLLEDDDDLRTRRERELTLSTGSILGIFFGLVLLCGLFFAFGYNMGSKSHQPALNASTPGEPEADNTAFDKFNKPSAGSPAGSAPAAPTPANSTPIATTAPPPAPTSTSSVSAAHDPETEAATPSHTIAPPPSRPAAEPMPATTPGGTFVVQIAALSHSGDAQLIVEGLRAKGYAVAAHSDPTDKLIHIQVGPFADKKSAEAMRSRLFADGYNAIVK